MTIVVHDEDDQPIPNAQVTAEVYGTTDGKGTWTVNTRGDVLLTVTADGFIPYERQLYHNPGITPIHLVRVPAPPPPPPPPPEPIGVLVPLRVNGWVFAAGDQPWTAIEASDFALLARFHNGEDISPVLAQRRDCGFNLLRVWTLFDIPGIGLYTSIGDYSIVPAFVDLCAFYGLYVEFTAYTGINDPSHWERLCAAALACRTPPLLELVNELDQNTNEPDAAGRVFDLSLFQPAPDPLLSSHGSNGSQHSPVRPAWSYETFHTNDAPEWWRKNGHNAMEQSAGGDGEPGAGRPVLTNESTRCPDRDSNEQHYYDAAAGAALLCAGSCFHSVSGKGGQLWTDVEERGARAHAAGARSVDLACQNGRYSRNDNLAPDELRIYQRTRPDGSNVIVRIRR